MKKKVYKEVIERAWSVDRFVLKGRKGTKIYKEERENHIKGMKRVTSEGEVDLRRCDYLIFEVQGDINPKDIKNVYHYHGIVFTKKDYGTEVSCHHLQAFSNGMVRELEELGYVQQTWKESMKEKGEYPLYINPKGWQWLYNVGSVLMQGMHKGLLVLVKKQNKKEENE